MELDIAGATIPKDEGEDGITEHGLYTMMDLEDMVLVVVEVALRERDEKQEARFRVDVDVD